VVALASLVSEGSVLTVDEEATSLPQDLFGALLEGVELAQEDVAGLALHVRLDERGLMRFLKCLLFVLVVVEGNREGIGD
jgi:hypothetical protein